MASFIQLFTGGPILGEKKEKKIKLYYLGKKHIKHRFTEAK